MATMIYKPRRVTTDFLLNDPYGPVGRHIHNKAVLVRQAAKAQVGVKTGRLRASIGINQSRRGPGQEVRIGSPLGYALMHHEGTRPHLIKPNSARVLRFTSGSRIVFAHAVRHPGTKPNRYLTDNLYLIR